MNCYTSFSKQRKWFVALVTLVGFGTVSLGGCGDKKMMTNTEEYSKAHGIVEGRTNDLRIKGVLFRFPPQYLPNPYSADKIIEGQADRVAIHMDLSNWFNPVPTSHAESIALVRVEIRDDGYGQVKSLHQACQESPQLKQAANDLISQGRGGILKNFDAFLAKWTGLEAAHQAKGVSRTTLTIEDKVWMLETVTGQTTNKPGIEAAGFNFPFAQTGRRQGWNDTYINGQYRKTTGWLVYRGFAGTANDASYGNSFERKAA